MSTLNELWFAMLTSAEDLHSRPGTDSPIGLVINESGVERLNHRFDEDTPQEDQERGQANLYSVDVRGRNIDRAELDDSSVRVSNLGGDQWEPELLYIWGEAGTTPFNSEIVPIAIETEITTKLSTDSQDVGAVPSMPVRLVAKGNSNMRINRLMLLVMTAGIPHTGIIATAGFPSETDDPIELEIVNDAGIAVKFEIPDTPQQDLERGQTNLYSIPVSVPFTKRSLRSNSIRLRIKGDDAWRPSRLFLFGLDDATGRPESIVPLVHVPEWNLGDLSTDTSEGQEQVTLPLVEEREAPDVRGVVSPVVGGVTA